MEALIGVAYLIAGGALVIVGVLLGGSLVKTVMDKKE